MISKQDFDAAASLLKMTLNLKKKNQFKIISKNNLCLVIKDLPQLFVPELVVKQSTIHALLSLLFFKFKKNI